MIARRLANLALVALTVYLGLVLAKATWLIAWTDRPVPSPSAGTVAMAAGEAGAPLASYAFFGSAPPSAGVAEAVRTSAPETALRLRLEGVLVGDPSAGSGAIVSGSDGETAWYRIGDTLPGNAELVDVEPQRILLKRNGRYETLTFEEDNSLAEVAQAPVESAESPDAFLADARAQLDSDGAAALARYGLKPVAEGGASGYVYDGSNPLLNAVNLKAGDVITAVNGQPLGDIEQDKTLLDSWSNQASLDIDIERDGSLLTISYAIPEQWR